MFETLQQYVERIWWCILAYSIAAEYIVYEWIGRKLGYFRKFNMKEFSRNVGRYAVVTGGSRGIGLEIVTNLLTSGYSVIIGSSAGTVSRKGLETSLKKKFPDCSVEVWHLDLASLKSVSAFADKYMSSGFPLHLLINNAGIMFVKEEITDDQGIFRKFRTSTTPADDGYEKHFEVNYLAHCLLTLLLLPLLSTSGSKEKKSRIINSTSCIHYVGNIDLKNLVKLKYYSKYRAYIDSKLAQVMFTYSLQSYLTTQDVNVTVNSVHPGVVNTELMTEHLIFPDIGSLFFKTAKEGAETATFAALSSEIEGIGGKYLEECMPVTSSKVSRDAHLQKELWDKTFNLLKPWLNDNSLFLKNQY